MIESKLIVVIAVLVTIFVGLAIYLFNLDRKMTKLENQISNRHETE
jgi:CcmD family protein